MAMKQDAWRNWQVVALAGGVGGAKLAHGLAQVLPPGQLSVVVNVADDFEHYGLHISPDLDTVMYTLAGLANPATGWGLADETWQGLAMLERYGEEPWFRLGDRDLATHLVRTQALASGARLTSVTQQLSERLGIPQRILPATDDRLRTVVETKEYGTLPFQHYFVKYKWQPTVIRLDFEGAAGARISDEGRTALMGADVVIICPSNPLLSIAPILAVPGVRDLVEDRRVLCAVVSPLIGGRAVKGPADKLMRELCMEPSAAGIADYYAGLVDILIIDRDDESEATAVQSRFPDLSIFLTPTLMQSVEDRNLLARRILNFLSEVS